MGDQRTMAQLLQAPTEGYEDAIVIPAISADNFELKHELHQLDTFYNALNLKDQDSLNSAAGGNFLDKMLRECLAIIESKSKVRYSRNKPVVTKVGTNTSTSGISPDVAELKDMVKALLLDKKSQNQSPAPVKAVKESYVTYGGAHSYHNCPATDGNVYRDNIQEFISQASAVNYNQGNTSYRPPMMSNQIRPPITPPVPNNQNVQLNQRNNQNHFIPNQNRGNNFNQAPVYQPLIFQPPAYQAPAPQTQGVLKEDFSAYVKANDAVMRNMQTQDFDADPRVPLILERLFLKTERALIDVFKGELTLPVGKEAMTFNLDQTSRYSANYNDMTTKRIDVIGMACEEYSQKVLGFLIDFLLEEVDAFLAIEDDPTSLEVYQPYLNPEGDILLLEAFLNDDPSLPPPNQGNYLPEVRKELKICEAKPDKSSIDEPPAVKLKDLPPYLEYAFLEGDDKFLVIIAKDLSVEEKTTLITVLKSHKRAIA
uniref:Reverse transcriptase domain-containing protein n=1 Tax=Tanacetum cinerariifolium TaxID=118510 RepID=A0A699HIJ4_TANCI|nr:hypothetical protein [Tanacetum cinerariifolium]